VKRLLAFGGFADDPQSVLAAVYRFALVCVELLLNHPCCVLDGEFPSVGYPELLVAAHAYPKVGGGADAFNDPKFAFWHEPIISWAKKGVSSLWKSNGTTTAIPML
jgi:hypothetical protein